MGVFRRRKKIYGFIGYYKLDDFWLKTLNKNERKIVIQNNTYAGLGTDSKDIAETKIHNTSQSKLSFIRSQISLHKKPDSKDIGLKFIDLGNKELANAKDIVEKHFYYATLIEFYYRFRADDNNYELAKDACRNQIKISKKAKAEIIKELHLEQLTGHTGFYQLAVILEKEKKFDESIEICKKALNEGWSGDWNKRIDRMNKKVVKLMN